MPDQQDEALVRIMRERCSCIRCGDCGGSGTIWVDIGGRYLGRHRSDDLDTMETCDHCRGQGVIETCERCELLMEDEYA